MDICFWSWHCIYIHVLLFSATLLISSIVNAIMKLASFSVHNCRAMKRLILRVAWLNYVQLLPRTTSDSDGHTHMHNITCIIDLLYNKLLMRNQYSGCVTLFKPNL